MQKEENLTQNNSAKSNNLEILKQNFSHCFDKNGDFDFDKFKKEVSENEIDFSKESYGMDWLGKSYARVLASDPARTLLKEDKNWNKKEENKNSENVLIKGDNLEVLKHLSNAYHEKVKMIYIDPPYNTGSDGFVYQDDRKFDVQEFSKLAGVDAEKSKRILDFVDSKSNSHSAWLTFMYPRLYIAKQLLKDDGVIFVSIDDNEVSQLKILMDEVFGEENFIGEFIWHKKITGGYDNDFLNTQHEYILCYSKNKSNFRIGKIQKESKYKLIDENGRKYKWDSLWTSSLTYSKSLDYEIEAPDGTMIPPIGEKGQAFWLWSKSKVIKERDLLKFQKDKHNNWKVYKRVYASEDGIIPESILKKDIVKGNTHSASEMKTLFGDRLFDYSKPVDLIKYFINIGTKNGDFILDFFAGSGTTGDSVMHANFEELGNRKFILVQLNEIIKNEGKGKRAYDFVKNELGVDEPTIFEITKERLVRAANKIKENNIDKKASTVKEKCNCCEKETSVKIPEQKAKDLSNIDFGFKIFETTPIWEDYNVESEEFSENLTLFDETKLSDEVLETLLTTWKTADNISLTRDLEKIDLDGYIANYFEDKLYLMNKGFETKNLKALLEKIDSDKTFDPKTIIAFGYHFESKNLREIAENIKAYSNKKNIDIDFITRY